MNFDEFYKSFNEKLKKINIEISEEQCMQFYNYMNLLIKWNEKINLTAIIEPEDIILKHFIDSLTINKHIEKNSKIADIGTGAGFPGIPLKILNKENKIVLIDSLNKRINFLNDVIEKNNLTNIYTIHSRVEDIGHNVKYRNKFDIVTARAVAPLNVLLEYMLPLLKIGGRCICMKGPNVEEELKQSQNAIEILGGKVEVVNQITLPDSDNKRTIIIVKAVKQLPNRYPRKAGVPTGSPL